MWACVVSIAVGLWAMIAPSLFEMPKQTADMNQICGPLFITFALIALWDINKNVIKANIAVALFLIVAMFFSEANTTVVASNVMSGVVVLVCSFINRKSKQHYGGGWKSLFQKDPLHLTEAKKYKEIFKGPGDTTLGGMS